MQRPHPPLWIGGNSRVARSRVARYGDGWTPLLNDETAAATTRTALIDTPARLATAVTELRQLVADEGRDPAAVAVQIESTSEHRALVAEEPLGPHVERLHELAAAGADWFVVDVPAHDARAAVEALARYGTEVIGPLSPVAGAPRP